MKHAAPKLSHEVTPETLYESCLKKLPTKGEGTIEEMQMLLGLCERMIALCEEKGEDPRRMVNILRCLEETSIANTQLAIKSKINRLYKQLFGQDVEWFSPNGKGHHSRKPERPPRMHDQDFEGKPKQKKHASNGYKRRHMDTATIPGRVIRRKPSLRSFITFPKEPRSPLIS